MKKIIILLMALLTALSMLSCQKQKESNEISASETKTETKIDEINKEKVKVIGLQGPTGMGLAKMINDDDGDYDFSIISSAELPSIAGKIINKECDICALPINMASVLSNKTNGQIKIIGANTKGVLYLLSNDNSITKISDLKGKTIYATGQGATPEYVLKYVLEKNGIDPEKDVKIEFLQDHTELATLLASNVYSVGMLPEPNVSAVKSANPSIKTVLDISDEWKKVSDGNELIQGVFIARNDFINDNPKLISKFLGDYKESSDFVNSETEKASEYIAKANIVQNAKIAEKAIPGCKITSGGEDSYENIYSCLEILGNSNAQSIGGRLPDKNDLFYYAD